MKFFSKKNLFILISLLVFFTNVFVTGLFFIKENKLSKNLVVKEIYVSDTQYLDKRLLTDLIGSIKYEYINSIKIDNLYKELSSLPNVQKVTILKKYPDKIIIKISEKNIKYVSDDGYFLDNNLVKINMSNDNHSYNNLIMLHGDPSKIMVHALFNELEKLPAFHKNIVSAKLISNRRWNILVNIYGKKILFKLPEKNVVVALSNFFKKVYKINSFFNEISVIDLRSDKIVISR